MKKTFTFLITVLLVALTAQLSAQSQRMGVIETFTGAACPPCAAWNPLVKAGIDNDYEGEAMYISWQVPIPSDDAMYDDNSSAVDARRNYYGGVNAAPTPFSQGQSVDDSSAATWGDVWDLHAEDIDVNIAEMSEFDLTLNGEIVNGELVVTGSVDATMAASGDFKLFLLITEGTVYNEDLVYPGTNGEDEFHHVFKDFVGGAGGIDLENEWAMGDSYAIDATYDLSQLNIYNYSELEITALVQNDDDTFIHQAARASNLNITVESDLSAAATQVEDIAAQCSGEMSINPVVKIANTGNEELTSCTITYDVNGGASQTYDWTGSLTTFSNENVTLPAYTFTSAASNTLNVEISNPNNGVDELLDDNTVTAVVPVAPEVDFFIVLEMTTDNYADEIYWEVQNSNGDAIASGGNPNVGLDNIGTNMFPPPASPDSYANNTQYSIGIDIPAIDCYSFHFADYYGDGVATFGGSYVVTDSEGNLLIDGSEFSGDIRVDAYEGTTVGVGVEEVELTSDFSVLANPVVDQLDLRMNIAQNTKSTLTVMDSQGRAVISDDYGTLSTGEYNRSYDVTALSSGMYYVSLTTETGVINKKVIIRK